MEHVFYEGKVLWSQIDGNMHLRHSAYSDFAAQARLEILEKLGFNANLLMKSKIGPILFREEIIYIREIRANDTVKVTCLLSKCRKDISRWSFKQDIYRGDGVHAATVHVDGAWIDTEKRRLTIPPEEWIAKFSNFPKTENFMEEPAPL